MKRRSRHASIAVGVIGLVVAVVAIARSIDGELLGQAVSAMADAPALVVAAFAAFGAAFVVRAALWSRLVPGLGFGQALAGLHLSLGANHVLPLRLGEPFRVVSVSRRTDVPLDVATASTVALRAADFVAVGVIVAVLGSAIAWELVGAWGLAALAAIATVGAGAVWWLVRLRRHRHDLRLPGPLIAIGALAAWCLEAVVVWVSASFAGIDLGFGEALVITTIAVAAQLVAIAPSGLGTYEAASVAAYTAFGFDPAAGLVAALTAHGIKTVYSLGAGAVAVVHPSPGFFGRLRLPKRSGDDLPVPSAPDAGTGPAPVVLFLPAHDEEAAVAGVVRRAPTAVAGHPVRVLVVDDGSTDATAARAAAAGAAVVSHPTNLGLGAAVRTGLAWASDQGAAAVAFCDADGEYAPEELEHLVGPVLAGEADYVVGSRFAGTIHHMRPHRRAGNRGLTGLLRWVARTPITDGQSGYRALSPHAAATAQIAHDFNYAQVLTLDLLARGARYHEVPITYSFRTTGRSFIRLGRYLREVVPAMVRAVNA
ncbi:MAG: lysylphosphatidylglycerol synthase domain-containing protein [Acidimicrobiales bacterium]